MGTLRALWHPLTPLALVLVVLPLCTLLAPPELRAGLLFFDFVPLSFLGAWASTRALRTALDRIEVPAGAPEPPYHEVMLERGLRWLIVLVSVLGTLAVWVAVLGVKEWKPAPGPGPTDPDFVLEPYQSIVLAAVPVLFALFGLRLWTHLASARRRRAQGLAPLPFKPASTTGDERLDVLLRPRARASAVLGLTAAAGSALANLLPPSWHIVQSLSKGTGETTLWQPWRFFTASFVHQDVMALVIGVLGFVAVAPIVEALLGKAWLVVVAVGGGVFATVMSAIFLPANDFMGLTGVDAALAGVLAFTGLLHRHRLPPDTLAHLTVRCLTVVVIVAFASVLVPTADVAAAFGGFGLGMLLSPVARPGARVSEALEKVRAQGAAGPAAEAT